jgi:hypothetical protein
VLTVDIRLQGCYGYSVPTDENEWTDLALGWHFQYNLDPLMVQGEGPLRDGWRLGVVLMPFEGTLVVAELRLFPDGDRRKVRNQRQYLSLPAIGQWRPNPAAISPESPKITGEMLRSISLPDIIRAVQEQWASDMGREDRTAWEQLLGEKPSAIAAEFVQSVDLERRAVGRPRRHKGERRDLELATIASHYADAVSRGSRSPIKDVAVLLGLDPDNPQDRNHIRDAKAQAVDKGYLVGTQDRKAAGALSKRAIEIIEAAAKEKS